MSDNDEKLINMNRNNGKIVIAFAVWLSVLFIVNFVFDLLSNKGHITFLIWLIIFIGSSSSFITWLLVRSNKNDITLCSLRNRQTSNALIIMGFDLLFEGKLRDDNTNQVVDKINSQLQKIGYKRKIDYNTIKNKFLKNPTNVVQPKKDNRGRKK